MTRSRKPAGVAHIAQAIDAGDPIDWATIESRQPNDSRREQVRQLRALARIVAAHREWSSEFETSAANASHEFGRGTGAVTSSSLVSWAHLAVLERLGRGASGEVFRARDDRLEREVALKILTEPSTERLATQTTRIAEGRLLARVRHGNVVAVYGAERVDGRVGIWMELVRGQTLDDLLRERGRLGATETVAIGLDLCHALSAVHQAGLLHRDIKARNVMREDGGRIVLMDFGGSREQTTAMPQSDLRGTLLYLAPEVLAGRPATRQSDIYSLGVLLFRLVANRYPVEGSSTDEVRRAHAEGRRQWLADLRPDLPEPFVRAVERAIAADPGGRFETAGAFAAGLTETLTSLRPVNISSDAHSGGAGRHTGHRRGWIAAGIVAIIAVSGVAWLATRDVAGGNAISHDGQRSLPSVAVLPFTHATAEPNQAYFADGMTDALVGRLSRNAGLRVTSRGSSQLFRDAATPMQEVGRRLRVDSIVEGSIQRSAHDVRIDVRLTDGATGRELWSRRYERPVTDIIAVQVELADEIAAALGARAAADASSQAPPQRVNPLAYEEYLKGRWHWNKRDAAGFKAALQHFNRAIGADPLYAPAHAGLTDTYSHLGMFGLMPAREALPKARAAGARALELDPTLFEPRASLAFLELYDWNWDAAERGLTQALALNPRYATAQHWFALHLVSLGRYEEAERAIARAMEIDPLSLIIANDAGVIHLFKRDFAGAERQVQKVLDLDPNFAEAWSRRGWARIGAGRATEAVPDFEHLLRAEPNNAFWSGSLTYAYAAAARRADAQRILATLEARAAGHYMPPLAMVMAYAGLRENDRAFAWMERAYLERSDWLTGLLHPAWDVIRDDPRFAAMMRRVGYPSAVIPGGPTLVESDRSRIRTAS